MTSKITEELATNAVRKSILLCRCLAPYISENDKGPSWDGFVYIYNSGRQAKKDYHGRVPVQVKGTFREDLSRDRITHDVDTDDLRSYARDGGVIYFVVGLAQNGYQERIYYALLTQERIHALLSACTPNQQQKSVEFTPFPLEESEKTAIIRDFETKYRSQTVLSVHPQGFSNINLASYWTGRDGVISEDRIIPLLERRGIHILDLHYGNQLPQIIHRLRDECGRDVCDIHFDDLMDQFMDILKRDWKNKNKNLVQFFGSCGEILVFRDLDFLRGRSITIGQISWLFTVLSASHSIIISGNKLTELVPDLLDMIRENEYFRICR